MADRFIRLSRITRHIERDLLEQKKPSFQSMDGLKKVEVGEFGVERELFKLKWELVEIDWADLVEQCCTRWRWCWMPTVPHFPARPFSK